jgi:hypothetical protein
MQPQPVKSREHHGIGLEHLRIFRPVSSNQFSDGFCQTKALERGFEESLSRREAVLVSLAQELNGIGTKAAVRREGACPLPEGPLPVDQRIVEVEEDESSRTIVEG